MVPHKFLLMKLHVPADLKLLFYDIIAQSCSLHSTGRLSSPVGTSPTPHLPFCNPSTSQAPATTAHSCLPYHLHIYHSWTRLCPFIPFSHYYSPTVFFTYEHHHAPLTGRTGPPTGLHPRTLQGTTRLGHGSLPQLAPFCLATKVFLKESLVAWQDLPLPQQTEAGTGAHPPLPLMDSQNHRPIPTPPSTRTFADADQPYCTLLLPATPLKLSITPVKISSQIKALSRKP